MPRALPPFALLATLALVLTGCAPAPKGVRPEPTAVAAPFASEEEALAAAVEVYDRSTLLADEIARAGGVDAERLAEVATGEFLAGSLQSFGSYAARGVHQIGFTTYRGPTLQQFGPGPEAAVVIYVCEDISELDIVDQSGQSVVKPGRPDTYYFLVEFSFDPNGSLKISSRQRWDDRIC